ncbi:MAG: hypothetical protein ACLPN5_07000 [Roseiarcus sp.]
MQGFSLSTAAFAFAFSSSLSGAALAAGGMVPLVHPAHPMAHQRIAPVLAPQHRAGQTQGGRVEIGIGMPVPAVEDETSPPEIETPGVEPSPLAEAPGYPFVSEPPFDSGPSSGPRIIYIGRDDTPPPAPGGPKVIYGDDPDVEGASPNVIYGEPKP